MEKLVSFTNLPSINETARRVQEQLIRGEETSSGAAAIGKIIEKDLGLTAKILKIANSVYYSGRSGPIGNVGQAVARLGIEEVSRICTTVSSIQVFANSTGSIDLKDFWKHSLGVAIVMRHIADRSEKKLLVSHNAYAAGLFHDIGILVFDRYFPDIFKIVLDTGKTKELPLFEIERKVLGIDHGEIGSLLCKKWRFPDEISDSVAWHHMPDSCPEESRGLSQLIHIANFTCSVLGIPEPGDGAVQMGSVGAWHDLELDNCDLNKIAEDVEEGIARSGVFVSLSL
jgi:putative nucleotidyltransferase with HDIG domain